MHKYRIIFRGVAVNRAGAALAHTQLPERNSSGACAAWLSPMSMRHLMEHLRHLPSKHAIAAAAIQLQCNPTAWRAAK